VSDPVVELDGVTAGYGDVTVVEDVSFAVERGEVVGLLGPNGVGKSTLLRCALGLLAPREGTVRVCGDDVASLDRDEVARRLGYVPQQEAPSFPATVFEAVLLGRKPRMGWRPGDEDHHVVGRVLESLGIADLSMRQLGSLSGGQRQQVLLARALAQEPAGLVLDEPTSDLDVKHRLEVQSVVREQAASGVAALHATHDLTLAARFSDRLVLLRDGAVYASGPPSVLTEDRVADVYGVRAHVSEDDEGRITVVPEAPLPDEA
jgi:iron complex transport system ATP-binding protein